MLLFFSNNYFIFSWIAKKCITTAKFLWQSYYTKERTVHFLKRKLALCLTKKPICEFESVFFGNFPCELFRSKINQEN